MVIAMRTVFVAFLELGGVFAEAFFAFFAGERLSLLVLCIFLRAFGSIEAQGRGEARTISGDLARACGSCSW